MRAQSQFRTTGRGIFVSKTKDRLFSKANIQAERDANAALRESMVIKRERLRALREKLAAERLPKPGRSP
jgi:hypothetical protein